MRTHIAVVVAVVGLALAGTGCLMAPVVPPQGGLYSSFSAPISTEFNESTEVGPRSGESSTYSVLSLVAWGDASAKAAAQNGRLTRINHVDYEFVRFLGFYSRFTLIAHGK